MRAEPFPSARTGRAAIAIVVMALLLAIPGTLAHPTAMLAPPRIPAATVASPCSVVNYTSSVDGFRLSYVECLPIGFTNLSQFPLIVYLHGIVETETTPLSGGYPTSLNASWVSTAATGGFILLAPNTRTGVGFYVDSTYTGPQRQDVLDAIASERSRHLVGSTFLLGVSMGATGAYEIAGAHPSDFAGVGAVVGFPDYFEEYAYQSNLRNSSLTAQLMVAISGGLTPKESAAAMTMWMSLSVLRFSPTTFAHLKVYAVGGGEDLAVPNNQTLWPYEQANNTMVNRSCLVDPTIGEPSSCTYPLSVLAALNAGAYDVRYVFEPAGIHSDDDLNFTDLLNFWEGTAPPGVFWAPMGGSPTDPPRAVVEFATVPESCGSVMFSGTTEPYGSFVEVPPGTYSLSAVTCPGYRLTSLKAVGNATYAPASGSVLITGHSVMVATFSPIPPPTTWTVGFIVDPSNCGPLTVNGTPVSSGGSAQFTNGSYPLEAPTCANGSFSNWTTAGAVTVTSTTTSATTVEVAGNGTVTAVYTPTAPPPPPVHYAVTIVIAPASCGAVVAVGDQLYASGAVLSLLAGNYTINVMPCSGLNFTGWNVSGEVSVVNGVLTVRGTGIVSVSFTGAPPPSGPTLGSTPPSVPWLLVAVGAVAVVASGGAVVWALRRRGPS